MHEHGRLYTIEVNDNWREWDDDLAVGSIHLIETLEFFLEVRKIGWDEPIFLDQFPFPRTPSRRRGRALTRSALDAALDRIDLDALRDAQSRQDALARSASWPSCCSDPLRRGPRDERGRRRVRGPDRVAGVRGRLIGLALVVLVVAMALDTTYKDPDEAITTGGRPAFDPQQYGEETYPKAVSTLEENAQPLPKLAAALAKDADAAASSTATARAMARTRFPVTAEGVAGKAKDGTLPVKVKGVPRK